MSEYVCYHRTVVRSAGEDEWKREWSCAACGVAFVESSKLGSVQEDRIQAQLASAAAEERSGVLERRCEALQSRLDAAELKIANAGQIAAIFKQQTDEMRTERDALSSRLDTIRMLTDKCRFSSNGTLYVETVAAIMKLFDGTQATSGEGAKSFAAAVESRDPIPDVD